MGGDTGELIIVDDKLAGYGDREIPPPLGEPPHDIIFSGER